MISKEIYEVITNAVNNRDFDEIEKLLQESKNGGKDYGLAETEINEIETMVRLMNPSFASSTHRHYEFIEGKIKEYFSQEGNNAKFEAGEWDHVAKYMDFETGEMCEKIVKIPHDSLDEEIEKIRKVPFEDLERMRDGWSDFEVKDWCNEWEVKAYLEECDESWITPDIMLRAYEMMQNC